ncbi:WecB/TagA/CpsF family glycosyltransferase [Sellimonas sp.]|uniref:WecB/TagA/CpsF family glycosyltransferase n=1 Tax=Sellimonas sp. TaxID=2021466 RepID=UPI000B39D146|nr:WecB/TagA/CpsF family glycosyltransferase [Sellimonas sp.]OUP63930.1 hypothetical protein B5F13_09245 [Drancourtella sp. An177]
MSEKIKVLGVLIDSLTAKAAMQEAIRYMETEPINTIEVLAGQAVIELVETGDLREKLEKMDLLVVGDKTLLELSNVEDRRLIREAETNLFLKMFMRYLDKGKKKVFLLARTQENLEAFQAHIEKYYRNMVISGMEAVEERPGIDDMIINKINGAETECVLSALPSPFQEDFVERSAHLLDARLWLGIGEGIQNTRHTNVKKKRIWDIFVKLMLKSEIKRKEREQS